MNPTGVFSPSRVVAGKYRVGRVLGEGGMGAVYEADHAGLEAKVAIKLLSDAGATDAKSLARFRREARAMGSIRHENVVSVMDAGTDEHGIPFLVMELLDGETLATFLRRERVVKPGLACWIASQVLAGLGAAHAMGVIHRDLKPGNIFIARQSDGSYRVKILDFGISKLGDATATMNLTADGALVGTPNFMAPEQITATDTIDERIDLYAVGVILYRMVTGRLPYIASKSDELYRKILDAKPTPPHQHNPKLPKALEAVVLKAMHPDRDRRYSDAAAFQAALRDAQPDMESMDSTLGGTLSTLDTRPPRTQDLSHDSYKPSAAYDNYPAADTIDASPRSKRSKGRVTLPVLADTTIAEARRRPFFLALVIVVGAVLGTAITLLATRGSDSSAGDHDASSDPLAGVRVEGPPLRFGITRHKPPDEIRAEMEPLLQYLGDSVGRPFELVIEDNYLDVAESLLNGKVDLAALSAYVYVRARRRSDKLRLLATPVTEAGETYEGYILARADSGIRELEQLSGKIFCYVSHTSTSGYLYPRALFRKAGMDPDASFKATRFTKDHTASLQALHDGACDGAAVYARVWIDAEDRGLNPTAFTMVARTDRMPWDAYAVTDSLDEQTILAIQKALVRLEPGSETARSVFANNKTFIGFHHTEDTLYDSVREIESFLDQDAEDGDAGSPGEH